jgi:hypothetical protein
MSVKRTVHERCPLCGAPNARRNADGSVALLGHACPKHPPGRPPNYPRTFREGDVIYVPVQPAAEAGEK